MEINLRSMRVFAVGVLLILSCSVRAQESRKSVAGSEEGKLLQQLIGEVREVRRELQEVGLNSYRAQLAIERLKFQQSRVGTLTRQL